MATQLSSRNKNILVVVCIFIYIQDEQQQKSRRLFLGYILYLPLSHEVLALVTCLEILVPLLYVCVCVWGGGRVKGQKHRLFFICLLDICYLTNLLRQQLMANIQLSLENSLDSKVFPADCHVVQCRDYCIFLQRTIFVVLIFIFSNFKNKATTCGENNRRSG